MKTNSFPSHLLVMLLHLSVCCQSSLGHPNRRFGSRKRTHPSSWRPSRSQLLVRGGEQQSDPYHGESQPYRYADYNQNTQTMEQPDLVYQETAQQDVPYNDQSQPYGYTNYDENTIPNYEDGFANVNAVPNSMEGPGQLFHETVQDRVDKWRSAQMERSYSPAQQANPRDEQGRMKLLATVSKGSRAFIYFVLMWRDIHLFELADQNFKGFARLLAVVPLTFLFIGNLGGVIGSLTWSGHAAKKRFKAILNLDKLVEIIIFCGSIIRLTIWPSKYTPREYFIASTLHAVFFLIQCQAFTRLTWDEGVGSMGTTTQGTASTTYPPHHNTQPSQ